MATGKKNKSASKSATETTASTKKVGAPKEVGSKAAEKALAKARERTKKLPKSSPIEVHDLMMLFMDKIEEHKSLFEQVVDAVAPKQETVMLIHGKTDKRRPA